MDITTRVLVFLSTVWVMGVSSGFVSQQSVWVGDSPALQYLLRCGLVTKKNSQLSSHDIYDKNILASGITRLQKVMGLHQTGVMDARLENIVQTGKCPKTKERLRLRPVGASECRCLRLVDRQGGGECRSHYRGLRWCYVERRADCHHSVSLGTISWSYSPCPNTFYL